jgi:O-antigen ligase
MFTRTVDRFYQAGLLFLIASLLLISFPRPWSLYPLGFFLFTGFMLWIKDFRNNYQHLTNHLIFILPPVIYFTAHLVSVLIQGGSVIILTDRLMFLLIPIFGLPLFVKFTTEDDIVLFKAFIAGIILVSIVLIIRILIFVFRLVPDDMTFFEYSALNKYWFFSANISVFEHPSYFSMKIIWVFFIFLFAYDKLNISIKTILIISLLLSILIFFLASRASIILWMMMVLLSLFKLWRKKIIKPVLLVIIIPLLIVLVSVSVKKIGRISETVRDLNIKLNKENVDWKNVDQRTREWYSAIQIIKENPLLGVGYMHINDRMRREYLKNGFYEEAKLNLNAHNQFLETQMTFGIPGTLSLLLMLFTLIYKRKRLEYHELATSLIIIISFFLMFESMFNRQWGIMFFMLFYFILSKPADMYNTGGMRDTFST